MKISFMAFVNTSVIKMTVTKLWYEGDRGLLGIFGKLHTNKFLSSYFVAFNYRLKLFDRLTKVSAAAITLLIVGGALKKFGKEKKSAPEII